MRSYADLVARGRARWGDKFSESELDPRFRRWYESGERIKVEYVIPGDPGKGETLTAYGTVGVTTGWQPSFLLMRAANARGSSYLIGPRDHVVAVKRDGKYVPVETDR